MRRAVYDVTAPKRSVSLTLNADLYARAEAEGINVSEVTEEAFAAALVDRIKEDIRRDIEALNAYITEHGSPAELAREHPSDDTA